MKKLIKPDTAETQSPTMPTIPALTRADVPAVPPVTEKEIKRAEEILMDYKKAKATLEERIIENDKWFKLQHWDVIKGGKAVGDPEPASAWLFNVIANKHADAMDNFPRATVLAREKSDEKAAQQLSQILPALYEQVDFEQTYSDAWWYKLKNGTSVYGQFWDNDALNGLGDVVVKHCDLLNLYWQPGVRNIQDGRNFFSVKAEDNEVLEEKWTQLQGKLGGGSVTYKQYTDDEPIDFSKKSAVVDWYYKRVNSAGKTVLHYCKFCCGIILFASQNMPEYRESGYYDHGNYPFVFDVLFSVENSPVGFGYIDICKNPQMYIDKLQQGILKKSRIDTTPRYFVRDDGKINENEYADLTKAFVHYKGAGNPNDDILPIKTDTLPAIYMDVLREKKDELKETSGNRDFSSGGTAGGVTAASAIAALQEAGNKLSRDMIKGSYRADRGVTVQVIELLRQFYDAPRWFRVTSANGATDYVAFDNRSIRPQEQQIGFGLDIAMRVPVLDISIKAEKASPYSTVVQNERAKEFFAAKFFDPTMADQALACLEMMDFEGKDAVKRRIEQNGTMYEQLQAMQAQMLKMGMIIDQMSGQTTISQGVAQQMQATQGGKVPVMPTQGAV
jgi:hypothetical protein